MAQHTFLLPDQYSFRYTPIWRRLHAPDPVHAAGRRRHLGRGHRRIRCPFSAVRVRGTIVGLEGSRLTIRTKDDQKDVRLVELLTVSARVRADPSAIKPGTYVGAAAMPGKNGSLAGVEVLIFPEASRGAGEGHRPFDLLPDHDQCDRSDEVIAADGKTVKLTYKGGEQTLALTPETRISRSCWQRVRPEARLECEPRHREGCLGQIPDETRHCRPVMDFPFGAYRKLTALSGPGGIACSASSCPVPLSALRHGYALHRARGSYYLVACVRAAKETLGSNYGSPSMPALPRP